MLQITIALAVEGTAENELEAYDLVHSFQQDLDNLLIGKYNKYAHHRTHLTVAEAHVDYLPPGESKHDDP